MEMKRLFIERENLTGKALKGFYENYYVFKDKTDCIYYIEKLVKELKEKMNFSYSLENFLDLTTLIDSYKAIDTLIDNEKYLQTQELDSTVQAHLEIIQSKYFKRITEILKINSITNYIEECILNWKIEYKDFDCEDIENLVNYAIDMIQFDD